MAMRRSRKRKAWVIVADRPRAPYADQVFGGVAPGVPLAVFPSRTPFAVVQGVVDAFAQNFSGYPSDMIDYLRREGAPYSARREGWGQEIMGGYNPYVEAFRVDDLQVVTDTDTGEERFTFTRRPPTPSRPLR